jgi:hypothetical protein
MVKILERNFTHNRFLKLTPLYVLLLNFAIPAKTLFLDILFAWQTAIGVVSMYEIPVCSDHPQRH